MKPHKLEEKLREIVEAAVKASLPQTLEHTKAVIRRNIPSGRQKTRRAIRHRVRRQRPGYKAVIRLDFAKKYPARGSRTQQILRDAWAVARPQFIREFKRNFSKQLNRN